MKHTILVATTLTEEALKFLQNAKDVEVIIVKPTPAEVSREIGAAEALIIRDEVQVDSALLDEGKKLKVIGRAGVSLTGIDVETATQRGVIVMNTPGANSIAAGEYALGLMLALSRQIIPAHLELAQGQWERQTHLGIELYGKCLGLIGLGRVGRRVAERALAFGMEVIAYDPYVAEAQIADLRVKLVGMDELLSRSDVISALRGDAGSSISSTPMP
ncbi:MAG: NAD(P)-dependent oxidoreductase [Anaerolineae bacterium]